MLRGVKIWRNIILLQKISWSWYSAMSRPKKNGEVRTSEYPQIHREVKTTNESAVRLLYQDLREKGQEINRIYAFATQTVQGKLMYM